MILLDANVLEALAWREHVHHQVATDWFQSFRSSGESFGAPSLVWLAFVRLTTNRKVISPQLSLDNVFLFYDRMTRTPGYQPIEPLGRHLLIFRELCTEARATSNVVADAAIAAIAIENGAGVASFDRDFARFRSLRWTIPGEA